MINPENKKTKSKKKNESDFLNVMIGNYKFSKNDIGNYFTIYVKKVESLYYDPIKLPSKTSDLIVDTSDDILKTHMISTLNFFQLFNKICGGFQHYFQANSRYDFHDLTELIQTRAMKSNPAKKLSYKTILEKLIVYSNVFSKVFPGFSQTQIATSISGEPAQTSYHVDYSDHSDTPNLGRIIFNEFINLQELTTDIIAIKGSLEGHTIMSALQNEINDYLYEYFNPEIPSTDRDVSKKIIDTAIIPRILDIFENHPAMIKKWLVSQIYSGEIRYSLGRNIFQVSDPNKAIHQKLYIYIQKFDISIQKFSHAPLSGDSREPKRFVNALSRFIADNDNYAQIFNWEDEADHLMQSTGIYGTADLGIHQLAAINLFTEDLFSFFELFTAPLGLSGRQYVNQFMAANSQNALFYKFYLTEKNNIIYSLPQWNNFSSSLDQNPYQTLIKQNRNLDAFLNINGHPHDIQFRNHGELKGLQGFMHLTIDQDKYIFSIDPLSKVANVKANRASISMSNPTTENGIGPISPRVPAYAAAYHPNQVRDPIKAVGLDDIMLLKFRVESSPGSFTDVFDGIHGNEHLDKIGIKHKGYILQKQNDRFATSSRGGTQTDSVWNMRQQTWYLCNPFPNSDLYYRDSDGHIQSIPQIIGIHTPLLTIQQRQQLGIIIGRSDLTFDGIALNRLRFKPIMLNLHRIVAQNLPKLAGFYPQDLTRALLYANTIQELFGISAPTMVPGKIMPQLSIIRQVPLMGYDDAGNSLPLPGTNVIPLIDRTFVLDMRQYWFNIDHAADSTIIAEYLPYSLGKYMQKYPNIQQVIYKKYFSL